MTSHKSNKRQKTAAAKVSREVLEVGGITYERVGRFTSVSVTDDDTYQRVREAYIAMVRKAPERHVEIALAIESHLDSHNWHEILAHIAWANTLVSPETHRESTMEGKPALLEYVSLLAIKRERQVADLEPPSAVVQKIIDLANEALELEIIVLGFKDPSSGEVLPDSAQYRARLHEFGVRNPAYPEPHRELFRKLFAPFASHLLDELGFTAEDAILTLEALEHLLSERISHRMQVVREAKLDLANKVKRARRGKSLPELPNHEQRLITELALLTPSTGHKAIGNIAAGLLFHRAREHFIFLPEDLVARTGVSIGRTRAFLTTFSLQPGALQEEIVAPRMTHPLKEAPLIAIDSGFHVANLLLLEWAIRPRLEEALARDTGRFETYSQHRHHTVNSTALAILKRLLPEASIYTNVYYPDPTDCSRRTESDGLVICGGVCIIVESKAGNFSDAAKRGAPGRLKRDLTDLVSAPAQQAARTKEYIQTVSPATFTDEQGRALVTVDPSSIMDWFSIAPTLASIGHLTTIDQSESTLASPRSSIPTWIVSVFDLMVVSDILEPGARIAHFLKRRTKLNAEDRVGTYEELDFFVHYLLEGLYFKHWQRGSSDTRIQLASYTDSLDAYMYHKAGHRSPIAKPAAKAIPAFETLLNRLRKGKHPAWLSVSLSLLDLDDNAKKDFCRMAEQARRRASASRRIADFSMAGSDAKGWGITYIADPGNLCSAMKLLAYVRFKRREHSATRWTGILDDATRPTTDLAIDDLASQ